MTGRNKEVVQAYVDAFNRRDLDAACASFSEHAQVYGVLGNGPLEITRAIWQELIAANDMRLTIDSMVAEGDTVAVKFSERGKSIGSFRGLPVTGKTYEVTAMEWFEFENGKIKRRWAVRDSLTIAMQLGLPLPA